MAVTWRKLAAEDDVLLKTGATTGATSQAQTFTNGVIDSSLTASRLLASDGSKQLASVSNLATWIAGTANQVTVTNDGDGSITLSLPQDIHTAATPTFGGVTAAYLRPAADSTTALQLQNAAGTAVVTVDTTNGYVTIGRASGNPTPRLILQTNASSGDPAQILMGTGSRNWRIRTGNSSDTYALHMDYIGTDVPLDDVLVLRRAGNISINTTKETNNLNVGGTMLVIQTASVANPKIEMFASAATGNRLTLECNTSSSQNRIYSTYSSGTIWPISFLFGATERLRFAPSAVSAITDAVGMWVQDYAAGDAGLYFISEAGATHKFASVAELPALIVNESGSATGDLRAESDTEANMLWLDASADLLYLGGSTAGVSIAKGGDTTFLGDGSGLPYGSCYGNEIGWAQASAAQNTWYEISDADMADGELNAVTHDGSGKLTVAVAGRYLINYTCSAEVSLSGKHIQSAISISGTESNAGISHFEAATAGAQFNVSGTAIIDLAANATVEVSMRTTDTGAPDIAVDHLNITVVMVGGT